MKLAFAIEALISFWRPEEDIMSTKTIFGGPPGYVLPEYAQIWRPMPGSDTYPVAWLYFDSETATLRVHYTKATGDLFDAAQSAREEPGFIRLTSTEPEYQYTADSLLSIAAAIDCLLFAEKA
jgi:hypothetical protein